MTADDGVQINTATGDSRIYAVQHGNQYVYVYRGRPPYQIRPYAPAEPVTAADAQRRPPSWLLAAGRAVVPFRARAGDLDALRHWRSGDSAAASVRLIHASGGSGKSRLAARFAEDSMQQGWSVAVAWHAEQAQAAVAPDQQIAVHRQGLLLVVDYAERWPVQHLLDLIAEHARTAQAPLRILLLARPVASWWQSFTHRLDKIRSDIVTGEHPLDPLDDDGGAAMYAAARDRFASLLLSPGAPGPTGVRTRGGLILDIHMAALVEVDACRRGVRPPEPTELAGLSSYLLHRERDHWTTLHASGAGAFRTDPQVMGRAVYVATLTRPLPYAAAGRCLESAGVTSTATENATVVRDHAYCYPSEDPSLVLQPLYPDRLGEDFLALSTPGHRVGGYTETDWWCAGAAAQLLTSAEGAAVASRVMPVLIETALRWGDFATSQLFPLLRERPTLALSAGSAALTRLAECGHADLDVLEVIDPVVEGHTGVELAAASAALATRLADRRLGAAANDISRADVLTEWSRRLTAAGRHQDALAASAEAARLTRRLAADGLQNPAVRKAKVLADLVDHLEQQGVRPAAAELIDNNGVVHPLAEFLQRTAPAAFEPRLADSLADLAVDLAANGRLGDAVRTFEEAVSLYRRLLTAGADVRRELAHTLLNLTDTLQTLGRFPAASSAAHAAEEVFAGMPAERLAGDVAADRARGWVLMARCLLHDGRVSDAQTTARRAVAACERLNDDAGSHDVQLASALSALNLTLVGDDAAAEALATSTAVVRIRRRLAAANPQAFDDDLAHALTSQAVDLATLGRYDEAADTTSAAVEIRRRLAQASPQAHGLHFVGALLNLVQDLLDSDRLPEALHASQEAIEAIDGLDGVDPDQWVLMYGRAATTYARVRVRTGTDLDRALLAALQSMKAFGGLLQDDPAGLLGPMVNAAHVLADVHEVRGELDTAADIRGRFPPLRRD